MPEKLIFASRVKARNVNTPYSRKICRWNLRTLFEMARGTHKVVVNVNGLFAVS